MRAPEQADRLCTPSPTLCQPSYGRFAHQSLYSLIQASIDGRPDDDLQFETDALVETFARLFPGLPRPRYDEDEE